MKNVQHYSKSRRTKQIVKKRKLETIEESEEADQTDGKEIDESRIKNKRKN